MKQQLDSQTTQLGRDECQRNNKGCTSAHNNVLLEIATNNVPSPPSKKHRTSRRLLPCIDYDNAGLAKSMEVYNCNHISNNSSEEEVAAMLICISSGHGFSCNPKQQEIATKKRPIAHSKKYDLKPSSNCKTLHNRANHADYVLPNEVDTNSQSNHDRPTVTCADLTKNVAFETLDHLDPCEIESQCHKSSRRKRKMDCNIDGGHLTW